MDARWIAVLTTGGMILSGGAFLLWSIISGLRKRTKAAGEKLDVAYEKLAEVHKDEALAWKKRFEAEHTEYAEYRQKTHDAVQATQARILRLTEDNAELKGKTDLTPIIRFHQEQGQINVKVVQSLDAILGHLKAMPSNGLSKVA